MGRRVLIRDFVEERTLQENEAPLFLRDPKLRQLILVTESFEPERILASSLQEVPLFSWEGHDEDVVILRAMLLAATGVRALTIPDVTPSLWPRLRGHMHAIVTHPTFVPRIPDQTAFFQSTEVPPGRLLCLKEKTGTLLLKSDLQGYVLPEHEGPLCVTVKAFVP